jgi:hypothetical protein
MGTSGLAGIREKLSPTSARDVLARLIHRDASQESAARLAAREWAWTREGHGWSGRFAGAMAAWAGVRMTDWHERLFDRSTRQRDVRARLLRADLAVRLHRHDQKRLPDALSQLVPRYFSTVPIDPFSGQPLVYRRQGEDFVLYSAGIDQRDDGGRFGTPGRGPASLGL